MRNVPSTSRDNSDDGECASAQAAQIADLARRLTFLGLTEADAARLQALAPEFQAGSQEFVRIFYDHLFAFPETAKFLQDPQRLQRLKAAQQGHFESLLHARWDAEFLEARRRAGEVHAELAVDPDLFLGAYNQYAQFFIRYFTEARNRDTHTAAQDDFEWLFSLIKVIFLDIGLTLDSYFARSTRALEQALSLYWRANEELRRFAQLTSHDLKTPLATVANRCEEALDEFGEDMPAGARELITQAHRGVFRMSRLIDELLASTIVEHDEESNSLFDCREAIEAAVERVQHLLDQKSIRIELPHEYPSLWGHPIRLREAVYNLLSNAAKFIQRPGGKIRVVFELGATDCILSVEDNGPGIPEGELDRVFVPFRRLPMHRSEPGSGLGLYFTKSLVEAQGGVIWVESELGRGSRFRIRLRRRPPDNAPSRSRAS